MSTAPHCPACNSALYTPDPSNGGAGRNKCLGCGQASPVAHWYTGAAPGPNYLLATSKRDAVPMEPGERRFAFFDPTQAAKITKTGQEILERALKPAAPIRQYKDD